MRNFYGIASLNFIQEREIETDSSRKLASKKMLKWNEWKNKNKLNESKNREKEPWRMLNIGESAFEMKFKENITKRREDMSWKFIASFVTIILLMFPSLRLVFFRRKLNGMERTEVPVWKSVWICIYICVVLILLFSILNAAVIHSIHFRHSCTILANDTLSVAFFSSSSFGISFQVCFEIRGSSQFVAICLSISDFMFMFECE